MSDRQERRTEAMRQKHLTDRLVSATGSVIVSTQTNPLYVLLMMAAT
jgi:hypothetical protein